MCSYGCCVYLLLHDVGPEHHPRLEHVVQGAGRPGRVHDRRHRSTLQGQFADVRLVGEEEGEVALGGLAPGVVVGVLQPGVFSSSGIYLGISIV